jgi:hypothetical protein
MNKLVEYLETHHNPGGNAIQHTWIDTILNETKWTREEVYLLALEARENEYVTLSPKTGYRIRDNDPESLEIIGLWNIVYHNMGKRRTILLKHPARSKECTSKSIFLLNQSSKLKLESRWGKFAFNCLKVSSQTRSA